MATKVIGGGSSAVAASSHAACARFRGTDPLITGVTRRGLAKAVGFTEEATAEELLAWLTVCVSNAEVEPAKLVSPA